MNSLKPFVLATSIQMDTGLPFEEAEKIAIEEIKQERLQKKAGQSPSIAAKLNAKNEGVSQHGDHVSKHLVAMNRAAYEFWSRSDRDDPATHPDNADVAAWLVENCGMSKSAAKHAASLIRPEWACTGRKPGKA